MKYDSIVIQRWVPGPTPNVEDFSRQHVYQVLVEPSKERRDAGFSCSELIRDSARTF